VSDRTLHLPLDFEFTEGVRLLAARCPQGEAMASLYALRLWVDWSRQRQDWRPLRANGSPGDWAGEPLALLIEQACGWPGEAGALVAAMLEAGLLKLEERDGAPGLRLPLWQDYNPHLVAGFRSHHSRAGRATARNRILRDAAKVPERQMQLAREQGVLLPGEMSPEAKTTALTLLAKLCAATNRPQFSPVELRDRGDLLRAAHQIAAQHTEEQVGWVVQYLLDGLHNPSVEKDPAIIVRDWKKFLTLATPPHLL
jgi:hypothetical protein